MPELGTYTPVTPATLAAKKSAPISYKPYVSPIPKTRATAPTTPKPTDYSLTDPNRQYIIDNLGYDPGPTAEIPGTTYLSPPETIIKDGRVILIFRDIKGNIINYQDLGAAAATGLTPDQQAAIDLQNRMFDELSGWQEAQLGAAEKPEQWRPGELALEQGRLAAQQQYYQWQQQQAEQQYKAQLAAQPINWLEYAAYTGQEPVVQPWMLPLMPQEYGLQTGQPIPGYTEESMAGMPSLLNPSAQYLARMGPTAQQQLYGYQQAQTGAMPEETAWRQWSAAPPGGAATGLSWAR